LKSSADFQLPAVANISSMRAMRLVSSGLMGPGLRQKSARITVPPGRTRRASCCTNLLRGGTAGKRRTRGDCKGRRSAGAESLAQVYQNMQSWCARYASRCPTHPATPASN
jgi:hypothetical protein